MDPNLGRLLQTDSPGTLQAKLGEPQRRASEQGEVLAHSQHVRPALRWAYYAFIFSLPIEMIAIGVDVSATRFIGYFFFLMALLNPGVCFRRIPTAQWWFGAFVCIYAILGMFQPLDYMEEIYERVFTLIQLLAFFWISYNLLRFPGVARGAMLTLGISCTGFALFQVSGFGGLVGGGEQRRAALALIGQNPNESANYFAVGLVTLAGLAIGRNAKGTSFRLLAWPLVAVLGLAIVQTGSRGGLLAAGVGLAAFMLRGEVTRLRVKDVVLVALALVLFAIVSVSSEASRQRWEAALAGGNLTHREQLYPIAWEMFLEQPILGWGPASHLYELGWRTRHVIWHNPEQTWRDTHNLFLHVATATGFVGSLPFLIGIWLCFRTAWMARKGVGGILPFALVVTILVANMSGSWIHFKLLWFILAYALATSSSITASEIRAGAMRLRTPIHLRRGTISSN
jgi:O-antigen ligase